MQTFARFLEAFIKVENDGLKETVMFNRKIRSGFSVFSQHLQDLKLIERISY